MWRVGGRRFSWSSTVQPSCSGRPMSSTIASGRYSWASARPTSPRRATMPLKPRPRATSSTVRAKSGVVLDDQDDAVARLDLARGRPRPRRRQQRRVDAERGGSRRAARPSARAARSRRAAVRRLRRRASAGGRTSRQLERERAALAGLGSDADLAAEQAGDLAADREARGRCRRSGGWSSRPPAGRPRRSAAACRRDPDPGVDRRAKAIAVRALRGPARRAARPSPRR